MRSTKRVPRLSTMACIALLALLAGPVACDAGGGGGEVEELSPRQLGELGGRLHAEPERSEEILAEAGLSAEDLEERVREVTADPEASRAYAEGFRETAGTAADGS